MSSSINLGAATTAPSFTATGVPGFIGDGSGLTNLPATSIVIPPGNQVVETNGTGHLVGANFLSTSLGGFGVNPTTLGTGAFAYNGTAIVSFPYTNLATPSTLVERDASGNFLANNVTVNQLLFFPNANAAVELVSAYVQTTNATPTAILTIPTVSNTAYTIAVEISFGNATTPGDTGFFTFVAKAKNIGGSVTTTTTLFNFLSVVDASLITTTATITSTGTNVMLEVTGVAATTINWTGYFRITQALNL